MQSIPIAIAHTCQDGMAVNCVTPSLMLSLRCVSLNALAFTGGAFDAAHWAQIAFGCFVPAAISGATYILA
jgi:hypothetical protein